MPYIKKEERAKLDRDIKSLAATLRSYDNGATRVDSGKLNYAVTQLILSIGFKPSYAEYNAVIGALECCKLEMYRRALSPYEDLKIKENGDVYEKKEPRDAAEDCW